MPDTATAPTSPSVAIDTKSDTLARFFRGLGDATRLRILFLLLEEERTVSELVSLLGSPQGRVSTHLACLRWCGFVVAEKEGRTVRYRIADERVRNLLTVATGMMADNATAIASCLIVGEPTQQREGECLQRSRLIRSQSSPPRGSPVRSAASPTSKSWR